MSSSAPLVGWASATSLQQRMRPNRNVGQVSQEAFPTLPTSTVSNQNKKKNAIRGTIGATRRQFAAMTTSANNQQQQQATWGAPSPSSNAFASAPRQMNRQADLAQENFPTLGRPSSSVASTSTNTLARQSFQQRAFGSAPPPSMNSASDFPSMQSSASVARAAKKSLKQPPSMNSASDFPAPPSAKPPAKSTLRQQMFGESDRKKPAQDNFLQADMTTTASAKATVEDMKASMGQKNFKQLKKLTKTFAQEELAPEGYVDQAASLFDKGYEDPDFWAFLPSLLQSCPNQGSAQHALKYMNSLKRQQTQTNDRKPAASTRSAASKWGGSSANASNVMRPVVPPPLPAAYAAPRSVAQPPVARSAAPRSLTQPVAAAMRPQTMATKKNSAWGAGGKSTVVRTKAAPGSVGAAAASQGPQGGSGTKFMAKQQKKQKQVTNGNNNQQQQQQSKAKKKKQKNELRELAFGK